MPRQHQGAAEVNIPIEAIVAEVGAWSDEIVSAVSNELLKETKANAAKAFKDKTGGLRKSIKKKKSKMDKDTNIVGAFWPSAHLIEHGHDIKVTKGGEVLGHVPAHPFLGPAEKSVSDRLTDIVNNVVGPLTVEVKK